MKPSILFTLMINHEYEHIKRDIELYLPKLKKDGIFGGHDYYEEK